MVAHQTEAEDVLLQDEAVQNDGIQNVAAMVNESGEQEADAEEQKPKTPTAIAVIVNGTPIAMTGKAEYVYVDVFDYIDFDLSAPKGAAVVTLLNGRAAKYMETLQNGDNIEIYWKK